MHTVYTALGIDRYSTYLRACLRLHMESGHLDSEQVQQPQVALNEVGIVLVGPQVAVFRRCFRLAAGCRRCPTAVAPGSSN